MEEGQTELVWLWLDTEKFGCGRRLFHATIARKWCHLVLVATGETGKLPVAEYERTKMQTYQGAKPIKQDKARKLLRRNAAAFGTDTIAVKEALEALK